MNFLALLACDPLNLQLGPFPTALVQVEPVGQGGNDVYPRRPTIMHMPVNDIAHGTLTPDERDALSWKFAAYVGTWQPSEWTAKNPALFYRALMNLGVDDVRLWLLQEASGYVMG